MKDKLVISKIDEVNCEEEYGKFKDEIFEL